MSNYNLFVNVLHLYHHIS